MRRYLRTVVATIGTETEGLVVKDLFLKFRVERDTSPEPVKGYVKIYNLLPENELRVRGRGTRVKLEVGYAGDELSVLFEGDIRRVERTREGLDRVTTVHLGGFNDLLRQAVFVRSYEGEVATRDIFRDAAMTLSLDLGDLEPIPLNLTEEDYVYNGSSIEAMTSLLLSHGLRWYEEDGTIRISRINESQDDRLDGILISERTGMIGAPGITTGDTNADRNKNGIIVRTLLDPRIRLDTRVRVESSILDEITPYKVASLIHQGDNRGGTYETEIEGKPITTGPGSEETATTSGITDPNIPLRFPL